MAAGGRGEQECRVQRAEYRQQPSPGGTGLRPGLEPGPVRTGPAHGTVQVPSEPSNQSQYT